MGRKKEPNRDKLLTRPVIIRLTAQVYSKLEKIAAESDCGSVGEAARRIISGKTITLLHKDVSMDRPMEELAGIRKELRHIGININQVTRHFHSAGDDRSKLIDAMHIGELYKKVDMKMDDLLQLISKLGLKWLQ